jgi:hypothetical protein
MSTKPGMANAIMSLILQSAIVSAQPETTFHMVPRILILKHTFCPSRSLSETTLRMSNLCQGETFFLSMREVLFPSSFAFFKYDLQGGVTDTASQRLSRSNNGVPVLGLIYYNATSES